jgi:hypothetical protein
LLVESALGPRLLHFVFVDDGCLLVESGVGYFVLFRLLQFGQQEFAFVVLFLKGIITADSDVFLVLELQDPT